MANEPPFLLTTERYEGHYRDPRVQQDPPTHQSHGRPRWGGPVNQGERLLSQGGSLGTQHVWSRETRGL